MRQLHDVRDRLLRNAAVRENDTLLDVGCGDGLIALGALDHVGERGRVIFSDVSPALLAHCREAIEARGDSGRCAFVEAGAEDLGAIPSASVDVVTTRSVLIYVRDKAAALREFHRVLRPGGRFSLFEPINKHFALGPDGKPFQYDGVDARGVHRLWGMDIDAVRQLAERVRPAFAGARAKFATAEDFDEHDLVRWARDAGFARVTLDFRLTFIDARELPAMPRDWEAFANAAPNPYAPSPAEAIRTTLGEGDDARQLIAHLRREFERPQPRPLQSAEAYLSGAKGTHDA
jgi:ubiquinone/menaquinone biosynthesis C-methylase UbiE